VRTTLAAAVTLNRERKTLNNITKILVIDPLKRRITKETIEEDGSTKPYAAKLGCEWITAGFHFKNGDVLFVDDEGLIKKQPSLNYFHITNTEQVFAGRGIIVGTRETSEDLVNTDVKSTELEVALKVQFPPIDKDTPAKLELASKLATLSVNELGTLVVQITQEQQRNTTNDQN